MREQLEHLRAFVRVLHPAPSPTRLVQFVLLRGRDLPQQRWLWSRSQEDAVLTDLIEWNAAGWDCYIGVNPRASMSGGERANIPHVTALPVDFDAKKTGGKWAKVATELERLKFAPPSIQVSSGNGTHAYWVLDADADPDDSEEICERLDALCASDDVWNASRIMRCPGTVNWKDPPKWCRWEQLSDTRHSLVALERRLTEVGVPVREPELEIQLPLDVPPSLQEAVSRVPAPIRAIIMTGKADGYPSNSEADWAVACALFSAGCTIEQATAVFRSYPLVGLKVASSPASYLARTLARAKSQVARDLAARHRSLLLPQPPFRELSPGRFAIHMAEAYSARCFWHQSR